MRWFLLQVKPTSNSYTNNLNNQAFFISCSTEFNKISCQSCNRVSGSHDCSRRVETLIALGNSWTKRAMAQEVSVRYYNPPTFKHQNSICDRITFARTNTYRNLTNYYHHPAGSFTTISDAIARVVYRHSCLMPVQMHVDTYKHVCMCGAICFVFANAANKLDVN